MKIGFLSLIPQESFRFPYRGEGGVEGMSVGLMLGPTRRELPRGDLLKP